ncbi:anhydro-N-acetylmuramic acid kinase [Pseudanabaena minima]|uniref:anhydro-N-acetylmuramic acid kinase n=1 Tax=Pseudanabaena minima TaxID=890415 RepID=UPI003DA8A338
MTHLTTDKILAIGLISGTSVDGIDAALVEIIDRHEKLETNLIAGHTYPYAADLRTEILAVCAGAPRSLQQICELDDRIAESFAQAAIAIMAKGDRLPDLIASHGQTVFHRPPVTPQDGKTGLGYSVQLGRGAVIAELTGIKTISDFRVADIEAGGHAAPLVPMLDILMLSDPTKYRVCQNIGGISNLTYLPPKALEHPEQVFGFDNGAGNVLLDMASQKLFGVSFDADGAIARQGKPNLVLINQWLEQEFFLTPPPKSTGRELFSPEYLEQCLSECQGLSNGLSNYDILATLTEFTARAIAKSYRDFLPVFPDEVLIGGGGGHNSYLMERLQDLVKPAIVMRTNDCGIDSDSKEAIAFAVLGYLRLKERYGNLPSVTGAKRSVLLGKIFP